MKLFGEKTKDTVRKKPDYGEDNKNIFVTLKYM